ncbi:MAG: response regulator transcription factor [Burkholderiales bacterium]
MLESNDIHSLAPFMLPTTVALVDDDSVYTEFLQQDLNQRGMRVDVFADSNDLLTAKAPFDYSFYVLDLMLPGIGGVELIKLLRRRTQAGLLVVSGKLADDVFEQVMRAGADMYLAKPVRFEQVAIAIESVHRRAQPVGNQASNEWRLDEWARKLLAPDGAVVELSEADMAVLKCFVHADGQVVSRELLANSLSELKGRNPSDNQPDGLNATIFRLRRRIEKATPALVPLQTKSRVGYVFKAPLSAV